MNNNTSALTSSARHVPLGRCVRSQRVAAGATAAAGSERQQGPRKPRKYIASDGVRHLGSALKPLHHRPFPGPPSNEGAPIRILPIGGLGEIGMNCMLVGVKDRYILIDAGLMFPDFADLGMQKILPDTSFLHEWKDKIEAVVITHGHEDHIGALPWVVPALDPSTPIYASDFVMQLVQRRMDEYTLWSTSRFRTFSMLQPFQAGPFEVTPVRVTHSIPDCCGLILRSEFGSIVHTGDWKIDENPVDGQVFDRTTFDLLGKENIALMMSDSTNVLSPGRTLSETVVEASLMRRVLGHAGKGRVICTQFASNLHRLAGVKKAADAAGRRMCFVGMSLNTYLEAAHRVGKAPFDPAELINPSELPDMDPSSVLVVTTGSQAEPRAQLSMAAREESNMLQIHPTDLILYSAKVIPGNEKKVTRMMNSLAGLGATVALGAAEQLHTSGHAYQEELAELIQYVKPQHFLPVHGEYAFLCAHATLAREKAGLHHTSVIRNGQMLGVWERMNARTISMGAMSVAAAAAEAGGGGAGGGTMAVLGDVKLVNFYSDGHRGTGTEVEMALAERTRVALQGIVIASVDVIRNPKGDGSLRARIRLTARAMWLDEGRLIDNLERVCHQSVMRLRADASLQDVEKSVTEGVKKCCKAYNSKAPEVIVFTQEADPRMAHMPSLAGQTWPPPQQSAPSWRQPGGAQLQRPQQRRQQQWQPAPSEAPGRPGSPPSAPSPPQPSPPSYHRDQAPSATPRSSTPATGPAPAASTSQRPPSPPASGEMQPSSADAGGAEEAAGGGRKKVMVKRMVKKVVRRKVVKGGAQGPEADILPEGVLQKRQASNPRDNVGEGTDVDFG